MTSQQKSIGHVEGVVTTTSTSTTTTAVPSYSFEWGVPRKSGVTFPAADKVQTDDLGTSKATDMDPFSLKTYISFDEGLGIFDGAGKNRIDTGSNLYDFDVAAPQYAISASTTTTTSTTSTTTTTTTSSTTTV